MRLSGKLHVQRICRLDLANPDRLLPDKRLTLARLCLQNPGQPVDVHIIKRRVDGAHKIMPQIGNDAAKRVGDPGPRRHQNFRHAKLACQRRCVKRACPAKGEQAEVTRVQTK